MSIPDSIEENDTSIQFGATFLEYVQLYARSPKPWLFNVMHPIHGKATIGLAHDRVVYAKLGAIEGEDAFFTVLCWDTGDIVNCQALERPHNISRSLTGLLLDAISYLDRAQLENDSDLRATQELDCYAYYDQTEPEGTNNAKAKNIAKSDLIHQENIVQQLESLDGIGGIEFFDEKGNSIHREIYDAGVANIHAPIKLVRALLDTNESEPIEELLFSRSGYHHILIHKTDGALNLHIYFISSETTLGMAKYLVDQVLFS